MYNFLKIKKYKQCGIFHIAKVNTHLKQSMDLNALTMEKPLSRPFIIEWRLWALAFLLLSLCLAPFAWGAPLRVNTLDDEFKVPLSLEKKKLGEVAVQYRVGKNVAVDITVTGTITDINGGPIPDATVSVSA